MSNQEVIQAWVEGRTGNAGTLATSNGCLWSYAALIGHIVPWHDGTTKCMVTTHKYSKTTSCHTSAARRAAETAGYKVETL